MAAMHQKRRFNSEDNKPHTNMERITLNDIAGLATEKMTWRLLQSLTADHKSGQLIDITPQQIIVAGDAFKLAKVPAASQEVAAYQAPELNAQSATKPNESTEVWSLGLLAFYALMGTDIFEHQGGKAQTPDTLIPRISQSHCSYELSDLIHSCLSFDPAKRPSMGQIKSTAEQALQQPARVAKRLTDDTGKVYQSSLVEFWPEEMVTLVLLLIFMLMPSRLMAQAQPQVPAEMQKLVNRCIALRQSSNVSNVTRELQRDNQWTLMDEIAIDRKGECTVNDKVTMFGLNDIGFRIFKLHSGVTNQGGRFRDGRDPRYSYSFIEVTVKSQKSVSYEITGREGSQLLAIVPHGNNTKFTATVTRNGKTCGTATMRDGVCYLSIQEKLKTSDTFKLTIQNQSGQNMAFAIINYNSRK